MAKASIWDRFAKEARRELAILLKQKEAVEAEIERLARVLGLGAQRRTGALKKSRDGNVKEITRRSKRVRRSPEDLKATAEKIVAFVKEQGEVRPKEIAARFGKTLPTPAAFVRKHAGVKLKAKGSRAKTTYHV